MKDITKNSSALWKLYCVLKGIDVIYYDKNKICHNPSRIVANLYIAYIKISMQTDLEMLDAHEFKKMLDTCQLFVSLDGYYYTESQAKAKRFLDANARFFEALKARQAVLFKR